MTKQTHSIIAIDFTDSSQERLRQLVNIEDLTFYSSVTEAAASLQDHLVKMAFFSLDGNPAEVIDELRALRALDPRVPRMILYEPGQEMQAAEAMRHGANGTILWDLFNIETLRTTSSLIPTEPSIRRGRKILDTISSCADVMVREPPWRQHVPAFLEALGQSAEAERAAIFACFTTTDRCSAASLVYEWSAPELQPRHLNQILQDIPLDGSTLPLLTQAFQSNDPLIIPASDFSRDERAVLDLKDDTFMLAAPIMVGGTTWGLITLEGGKAGIDQPLHETAALQMASRLLGSTILREQTWEDYRSILEQSLQGIIVFVNSKVAYANPQVQQWAGHTLDELRGLGFDWYVEHIHPDHRQAMVEGYNLLQKNQILSFRKEFRIRMRGEYNHWFESVINRATYNGQAAVQVLLVDITEHKEAEDRLKSQLYLNEMLTELSSQLLNADPLRFPATADYLSARLACQFSAEWIFIALLSPDEKQVEELLEWNNGEIKPLEIGSLSWSQESWRWLAEKIMEEGTVLLPEFELIPPEATEIREMITSRAINSTLVTKMTYNQRLVGFLCMATGKADPEWRDQVISTFHLVGDMLAGVIARRQAESALRDANNQLEGTVALLEKANETATQFIKIGNRIQQSTSQQEVIKIVCEMGELIFPGTSGQIYFSSYEEEYPLMSTWGEYAPCLQMEEVEQIHSHIVQGDGSDVLQGYSDSSGHWLCAPLFTPWENFGVICLDKVDTAVLETTRYYLQLLAERISLTLTSLQLGTELRSISVRDALTGLHNRRYLEEALSRELEEAANKNTGLAVLMVDLDLFKKVNDHFGHDAGDCVLRHVARYFQGHVRVSDIICRYGGDEFLVILPGVALEEAMKRAEELRAGCEELPILYDGKQLNPVRISIGVAVFPEHGDTDTALVRAADRGLYRSKAAGRNRVELGGLD